MFISNLRFKLSCYCTNDSNINTFMEVPSKQTCGLPCTYNDTQYCGATSFIGAFNRINCTNDNFKFLLFNSSVF